MGYAKLLSPKAIEKLEQQFGYRPVHPAVAKAFDGCGEPKVWPPVLLNGRPIQFDGRDFPIKSTDARGYSKREALSEAQNHRCCYCGEMCKDDAPENDRATVEHVVPKIAGGRANWGNEVMACRLCNSGRGAMRAERYFEAVQEMGRWKAAAYGHSEQRRIQKELNCKHRCNYIGPELAEL